VRGSAPLLTLALPAVLDEAVVASGVAGIVLLAAGIMSLVFDGGWRVLAASRCGTLYAAASLCITAYTLSDRFGARTARNANQYVLWLLIGGSIPLLARLEERMGLSCGKRLFHQSIPRSGETVAGLALGKSVAPDVG
jgi:hypothetical protein